MNYFDKNKILTVAVVILLLTNIGILSLLWFDRLPSGHHDRMPPPERMSPPDRMPSPEGKPFQNDRRQRGDGPKEFLIHELNFNENQKQDYQILIDEHKSDMKRLTEKIRNDKERLWNNLSGSDSNYVSAESISAEIGTDQKEIELVTFKHFQKVREICDDTQKKKFDELINEVLNMMGQNNPPPPPQNKN